jgi:hypothetical protein
MEMAHGLVPWLEGVSKGAGPTEKISQGLNITNHNFCSKSMM